MKNKTALPWLFTFLIIILLTQDHLVMRWNATTSLFGFPNWLGWFIFVHILFLVAFYWFSKKYWNE